MRRWRIGGSWGIGNRPKKKTSVKQDDGEEGREKGCLEDGRGEGM
jgi:hypothetical protein